MTDWRFGRVSVRMVPIGSGTGELDVVVKSKGIALETPLHGSRVILGESVQAKHEIHWPDLSLKDRGRRKIIYDSVRRALMTAVTTNGQKIGIYTLGLELMGIPSWEVAEEVVRSVRDHSVTDEGERTVTIVTSSPLQTSSFEFALDNAELLEHRHVTTVDEADGRMP
ncbi:MAG: hypothetical protein QXQ81_04080 [Candidatus Thorarchaeota archaeon]